MIKKEISIGIAVALILNTLGVVFYLLLFSQLSVEESLLAAQQQNRLGGLIALGALPNMLAFFGFLKLKRDHRAKGVLIATLLTAVVTLILKFF